MEMPTMKRMYHAGEKTNHDYPTDFEYLPFDVFAHCHKDIDTNMHYHATEIVTNGYEIELKTRILSNNGK